MPTTFALSRCLALVALCFALSINGSATAQEQTDGPIRLLPNETKAETDKTEAEKAPTAEPPPAEETGVAVLELGRVDPSSVGVLIPATGGFAVDLWAGSRREIIEALIPRIPDFSPSRTVHDLRRRLLMTAARVPDGVARAPSFLGLRVERLAAAGHYNDALALAALASPEIDDPVLEVIETDGALLSGDHQAACAVVGDALAKGRRDSYWVRVLTFCRILAGDTERARLTAAVLRELPGEADPLFDRLIAILAGDASAAVEDAADPMPLHLAMIRAARRAIPDTAANSDRPAILRAVATSPNASIEARLAAAEVAEVVGVLPAESLAQIYASLAFDDRQRANALSEALTLPRTQANALLFQAAVAESIPAARAETLRTALRLANVREHGMLARVNADRLASLNPDIDLLWFAADAGLAHLHGGSIAAARNWFDLSRQAVATSQSDAAVAVLRLWPPLLVAQAPQDLPWVPEALTEWWMGVEAMDPDAPSTGASVLSLLDAVGLAVPPETWAAYLDVAEPELVLRPSIAILRGMRAAASGGRVGETVTYALVALGNDHPSEVDTATMSAIVGSLVQVGLSAEARGLALEAMVGRSL